MSGSFHEYEVFCERNYLETQSICVWVAIGLGETN